jgi:hypothetical protein
LCKRQINNVKSKMEVMNGEYTKNMAKENIISLSSQTVR